jgi:uncharacterized protein YjeT (DUF2065 family)
MAANAAAAPDGSLRIAGVAAAIVGVLLVWMMRGE